LKTLEELRQYYDDVLLPDLTVLEAQRKKVLRKIVIAGAVILPVCILLAVLFRIAAYVFCILGAILWLFLAAWFSRAYVSKFKTDIIKKIVKFIDESLVYSKDSHVKQGLFTASCIFKERVDEYDGDDHVTGMLEETKVQFSEIHAQHVSRDSKGRRRYHTIFKGLFFMADFNKEFKGITVVLPDTAERLFGHIGTMLQSWNIKRADLVKLEDPEFEKMFVVYGKDQIEARYVLSTSLMRRIVEFKKKTKRRVYLSFVGSKIFVAVAYGRDLFEPRIFRTLLDFAPVREYFEDLGMAAGIVKDLNLNTRIWTK